MIRIQYDASVPGYHVDSIAPSDPLNRVRFLGHVRVGGEFHAYGLIGDQFREVAHTDSLPAAIHALIDLHQLTGYQYAPWPTMEEDEE